ncbi:MAG: hypothetical protein ACRDJK_05735, partial [Actinomycetota bacterium]
IGTGVFAEVAHRPRALAAAVRSGLRSSLVLGLAAAGGLAVMGELVLSILGPGYATGGAAPLRILVVALVPFAFIQAYFAVCRATGRLAEALVTGGVSALAGIGGSALVAPALDLSGMAAVWVGVQVVTGCWSAWRVRRILAAPGLPGERAFRVRPGGDP